MNPRHAEAALILAFVLFVFGFLLLCDCPGLYLVAASLAGLSAWKGIGWTRILAIALAVASFVVAAVQVV